MMRVAAIKDEGSGAGDLGWKVALKIGVKVASEGVTRGVDGRQKEHGNGFFAISGVKLVEKCIEVGVKNSIEARRVVAVVALFLDARWAPADGFFRTPVRRNNLSLRLRPELPRWRLWCLRRRGRWQLRRLKWLKVCGGARGS